MASFVIEGGQRSFADNLCHVADRRGSDGEQYT